MSNSKISNLIAIKSFYESKNDFISAFSYFVLQVVSEDKKSSEEIKDAVRLEFNLEIPLDLIKTILKRLKRENLVEYNELESVTISETGEKQCLDIQTDIKKSTREFNSLLESMKMFIKNRYDQEYSIESIEQELNYFVKNNLDSASLALQGDAINGGASECKDVKLGKFIFEFFKHVEVSDDTNFNRLKSLVYGIMIVSILKKDNFDVSMSFEPLTVYLDTNIVFSLMGLHDEAFNKPTQELIRLMQEFKFKLKIFSFTKEEILHVLGNYINNNGIYSQDILVDSVYLKLKQEGYTDQDVRLLIQNIASKLQKFDIEIDNNHKIDAELIKSDKGKRLNKIKNKGDYSINHDLSACEAIEKIRGEKVYAIERSRAIFLTADKNLYNFNLNENGHLKFATKTMPEVITRDFLVSILWLKKPDPNSNLPIHNIIAGYRRNLLVSPSLWDRFISALKNKRNANEITDSDIALIISSNETENLLLDVQHNRKNENLSEVIDDLMQKQIDKDKSAVSKIESKENETKRLVQELREKDEENLRLRGELNGKNEKDKAAKELINKTNLKKARRIVNEIVFLVFLIGIFFSEYAMLYWDFSWKVLFLPFIIFFLIIITLVLEIDIIPENAKKYLPPIDLVKFKQWSVIKVKNIIE